MAEGELSAVFRALAKDAEAAVKRISDKIAGLAENGAARARASIEDAAKTDHAAADRILLAGRRPGDGGSDLDRLKSALDEQTRGKYSDAELNDILAHGKSLGLTPEEAADFAKAGAIPKKVSAKYPGGHDRIPPEDLKQQMANWANEVKPRGYPYLFESQEQFQQVIGKLNELGEQFGLPKGQMIVQGSSLRTPGAKDIDVALIVPDKEFDVYAAKCADGITARARPRNQAGLLSDLQAHVDKGFIPQFMFDRAEGASQTFSQLSRQAIAGHGVSELDFSVMKQSSVMALYPHLDVTRSAP
ncbi:MAG TPA: hypothetical protein VGD29_11500 [Actinoplanes sp.]|jgi:hypothetical protein